MVIVRTRNYVSRVRDAVTLSALLLVLPAVCPAQGPQPPCGQEPTPRYPGLDEPAIVKSWSNGRAGRLPFAPLRSLRSEGAAARAPLAQEPYAVRDTGDVQWHDDRQWAPAEVLVLVR